MSYGAIPYQMIVEFASANGIYTQLQLPLELPPEYTLPMEYFCSINTGFEYIPSQSNSKCSTTQSVDHPGFARLRDELTRTNHINKVTNYINGDTVLKRFRLNGKWFEPSDKFSCACAMKYIIERSTNEHNEHNEHN